MKNQGLWSNIHAKRKRIKEGSGEKMRKKGSKGAPTDKAIKQSQTSGVTVIQLWLDILMYEWIQSSRPQESTKNQRQ